MLVRSEYSFREVFGPMREVVARLPAWGGVIADTTCYGHVPFFEECKKAGKRAILGVRFMHEGRPAIVIPRSAAGLKALYGAVAGGFSADAVASAGREWAVIVPAASALPGALRGYFPGVSLAAPSCAVASSDNLYPAPGDRQAWGLMLGRLARNRPGSAHILSPEELALEGAAKEWIDALRRIIEESDTPLPRAENIRFPVADAQRELAEICRAELARRLLDQRPGYAERLEYELRLIEEKQFADYFLVIADMMRYAKQHMLVGPARGSSAGSLVCWLTRITEIDPIRHKLIFERFIDINRFDLPDIDIDFPDTKRELVIQYLGNKYGQQNVAHIGTVIRYKPKSALTDVAKQAGIPLWELDKLKDVMIVRSSGDSRASSCLADSLAEMEIGRQLVAKYPVLKVAARLEDHARSAGVHAAGIVVCNAPVADFCGVKNGEAQLDKGMAEKVNLLKIDALGLRTLSVIEEACALAGLDPLQMYELPLEDPAVFALFNAGKFSGIFQYEGIALQSVARQIKIDCFEDVAAITALARPGPLSGGETTRWIEGKKRGRGEPLHPVLEPYTRDTYGTVLYQEVVMQITRSVGNFSWADTAKIRKLISNRKGNEAFGKFEEMFMAGAAANGVPLSDAQRIWKAICTHGSWSFNRCISGNTKVRLADTGSTLPLWMSMEELYVKYRESPSPWIRMRKGKLPRLWCFNGERAFPVRPVDIIANGKKLCVQLLFSNGAKIECTKNHKFLINGKWAPCGRAAIGDKFLIAELEPTPALPGPGKGHAKGKRYGSPRSGFPRGEGNPSWDNGRSVAMRRFKEQMREKPCADCGKKHKRMEVHHKDECSGKLNPRALLWLCPGCHKRRHYAAGRTKRAGRGLKPNTTTLLKVKSVGLRMTFDIEMPAPNHNYVIEGGLVTHNSHAVAYGLLSYWTGWLKAHHPVPFAVANLRHARHSATGGEKATADPSLVMLRELLREGDIEYTPVDPALSTERWEFAGNRLLGPLTGIKGLGPKTARDICLRRLNNIPLTARQVKLLAAPSRFADYAPCRRLWQDLYDHPERHFKTVDRLHEAQDITLGTPNQRWVVLGQLIKKNLRDLNEEKYLARRNGKRVAEDRKNMLLFHLEDDSGRILCCINSERFARLGIPMVERAAIGAWFVVSGFVPTDFRMLQVDKVKWLEVPKNGS